MKRTALLMLVLLMLLCGLCITAQADGYTEFCPLDAHFTWNESVNVRVEPYTSSATNGTSIEAGDVVFIKRLVKNSYGNLWAELSDGGFVCFYDMASEKECATFVGFNNGAAPVTTSNVVAPDGEIGQGTSFTFSAILDSSDVCPIYLFDIWCGQDGGNSFDELIQSWPGGVTTRIDITDYNINELYDISTLPTGEYTYMIRVWMGFTYEGNTFCFGDKYIPIQKNFTITEKAASYTVPSGSLSTKLSYLRNVFPNGWYWNHWSESDLGSTYTMKIFTVNGNATTVSNKPCVKSSSLHANVSNSTCNHYWGSWQGVQCTGFARMMFELVWDMDTETESYGMYYHPDTDNADVLDYVKPGDMVWTGGHMFLVTAVNGDSFTVVHCNRNGTCNIEWDYTYTKDWVHARMKANGSGYVASPTPIVYGSDITNWTKYQVVTSALNVRKWASTSVDKSCTMQQGDYFYVDLNHTITKSGNLYGYCRTADGQYGWVQFSNTSYAVPVEEDCEHANTRWVCSVQATCTEYGVDILTCSDCGAELETNTYLGHEWGDAVVTQEATCEEDGEQTVSCVLCGAVVETQVIPATGHAFEKWVTTKEPTCTVEGEKYLTCTSCGATSYSDLIPVTDHTAGEWVTTKEPTCTEAGVSSLLCNGCGMEIETTAIPATLHVGGEWYTSKEPTCTEDGESSQDCTVCGEVINTILLWPIDHTAGEWVVITEATATTTGLKRQSCTVCGETLAEEVIPATGDEPLSSITMSAGENLTALPGGTVTVPVYLSNPDADMAIGVILLRYSLPDGVTITNVEVCGIAAGADKQHSGSTLLSNLQGIQGSGQFLKITFQVSESVTFPLSVKVSPEVSILSTEEDITLSSFSIVIEEGSKRIPGDVNDDGKVSTADFLRLSKYLAEWPDIVINESNSDVNADGKVSTADFLRLAKYLAEWPDIELK